MTSPIRLLSAIVLAASVVACGGSVGLSGGNALTSPSATARPRYTPIPTEAPSATPAAAATPKAWAPDYSEIPDAANDPALLAQQIVFVEAAIRDPNVTGTQLKWMGHMQQVIYSRLGDYPDWRDQVVAALPESQRVIVGKALDASKELRKMHFGPAPKELPNWRIVTPPPAETLIAYYKEAEATFGVPWYYLASINLIETRMGRIRGLSVAGAQGPMQFMPATWAAYGQGDVNDPHDAIMGAARYLKAAGAPGNMPKALWAYNHSDLYVNAVDLYAQALKQDPTVYRGYHGWQVYAGTVDGVELLPEGWVKQQ